MKPTKKAIELLKSHFLRQGKVYGNAVDTCEGTAPLWGQLHLSGLVVNRGSGVLGHPFCIELTKDGQFVLESLPDSARTP